MRRLLLLSLLFIACDNQSKEYTDITTSERNIQYYELKENERIKTEQKSKYRRD